MPDAPRRRRGRRAGEAHPPGASPTPSASGPREGGNASANAGQERARTLSDGRVQMLVYLPPTLVKSLKRAALDRDTSASHVVEQALMSWLEKDGGGSR